MTDIFDEMVEEEEKQVQEVDLGLVSKLISDRDALDEEIEKAEDLLRTLNHRKELLLREDLPTAMAGLKKVTTLDGVEVTIKDKMHVNVPKKNQDAYLDWLRSVKMDAIIKDVPIIIPNDEDTVFDLIEEIKETHGHKFELGVSSSVHAGTTKALVKRMKEEGKSFPQELFNIFEYQEAHIKKPRRKKNGRKKA